jgi:hypothetical protein
VRNQGAGHHHKRPAAAACRLVVHPPEFVALTADDERKALDALVALLVLYLRDRHSQRSIDRQTDACP